MGLIDHVVGEVKGEATAPRQEGSTARQEVKGEATAPRQEVKGEAAAPRQEASTPLQDATTPLQVADSPRQEASTLRLDALPEVGLVDPGAGEVKGEAGAQVEGGVGTPREEATATARG